ncbi:MAG: hypothetical protein PHY14_03040 [Candidatus Gracilibacteria bacterium]|nr:hypothetical protein [Candidatus Gracilibacteria bacterium]
MSLSEINSLETVAEHKKPKNLPGVLLSINDIMYSLPMDLVKRLPRGKTGHSAIATKLRNGGIDPTAREGDNVRGVLLYCASNLGQIHQILEQSVRPPLPDAIEKAGSMQAYEQQLAANHRRSDGEFVPTMDETIL